MSEPVDLHDPHRRDERLDLLTLAALREPLDPEVATHLVSCPLCAAELRQLTATVDLAREGLPPAPPASVRPPNTVWDAIAREVGSAPPATAPPATAPPDPSIPVPAGRPVAADRPSPHVPSPRRTRTRHRRRSWWVGAVAAVAVVAAGVGGFAVGRDGADTSGCPTAGADLAPVGGAQEVTGRAELVCSADGPALRVRTDRLPIGTGFYEVWMYQPTSGAMVPVGTLGRDGSGTFTLPGGMDVRDYPVVDVSVQQYDNDPTHGTSVLQGPLTS